LRARALFSAPVCIDRNNGFLLLLGGGICGLLFVISGISPAFEYGRLPDWKETILFVSLLSFAGILYVANIWLIPRVKSSGQLLTIVLLIGVIARSCFFGSTPIFEDDWYRYLWDGAVVNAGINPYAASPAQAMLVDLEGNVAEPSTDPLIARLQSVGESHPHFPERVNYPFVTTIYPPIAQTVFASANLIAPFNLDAFRLILLSVDGVAVALLIFMLRFYGRSPLWAVLYWWNPLVIVTGFNAAHMDILIAPLLLATLAFAEHRRPRFAAVTLAAAAGVKLWPLILTPVLFRAWRNNFKEIALTWAIFSAALLLFVVPLLLSLQSGYSGLGAYASEWVTNSFIFTYLSVGVAFALEDSGYLVRFAVAGTVGATALWFGLSRRASSIPLPSALLITVLLLFFLSPTGYPWYAIWFLVFAPFAPMTGVALLTVTLPIYYLRFLMTAHGWGAYFNFGLTPIEFGTPLAVLLYELKKNPPWRI